MAEHSLKSVAFPKLDDSQIAELGRCTTAAPKSYKDGETLIKVGQRNFSFFVVKSGEIEIMDLSGDTLKTVVVHHKGQFPGDVSHITDLPPLTTSLARRDCAVLPI